MHFLQSLSQPPVNLVMMGLFIIIIIHVHVNNACDGAFDETYLQALSILTVSSDMQILNVQYLLKDILLVAHSVDLHLRLSFYNGIKSQINKN